MSFILNINKNKGKQNKDTLQNKKRSSQRNSQLEHRLIAHGKKNSISKSSLNHPENGWIQGPLSRLDIQNNSEFKLSNNHSKKNDICCVVMDKNQTKENSQESQTIVQAKAHKISGISNDSLPSQPLKRVSRALDPLLTINSG